MIVNTHLSLSFYILKAESRQLNRKKSLVEASLSEVEVGDVGESARSVGATPNGEWGRVQLQYQKGNLDNKGRNSRMGTRGRNKRIRK